jgi:hypothetical protein
MPAIFHFVVDYLICCCLSKHPLIACTLCFLPQLFPSISSPQSHFAPANALVWWPGWIPTGSSPFAPALSFVRQPGWILDRFLGFDVGLLCPLSLGGGGEIVLTLLSHETQLLLRGSRVRL